MKRCGHNSGTCFLSMMLLKTRAYRASLGVRFVAEPGKDGLQVPSMPIHPLSRQATSPCSVVLD